MTQPQPEPTPEPSRDIVAHVDFQYRWRSWAFAILMLAIGLLCLRDGFVVWPRENAAWEQMGNRVDRPTRPPHDPPGVLFNQFAGILCTAVSIPFLIWRESVRAASIGSPAARFMFRGNHRFLLMRFRGWTWYGGIGRGSPFSSARVPGITRRIALMT